MKHLYFYFLLFISLSSFSQKNEKLNIIKLNSISPNNCQFDDLKKLKNIIGEAQIVLLGEPTHGEGNVFEAKTRLVKFLHQEMDFNVLAFESSFYDFNKIPQSISEGDNRTDCLKSCIFPIWTESQEFQEMLKYLIEQKSKLQVTGFDCQFKSEYSEEMLLGDLFILVEKLGTKLNEKDLNFLNESINYLSETLDVPDHYNYNHLLRIIENLERSLKRLDSSVIINYHPVHFWQQILFNIKKMAEDYYQNHPSRKSIEEFKASDSNNRDALMADNLLYFIKHNPKKKMICWGANAHFANQLKSLNNEELNTFVPMGNILKKELGDKNVFILGTTCAIGQYASISEKTKEIPNPLKESIEAKLIADSLDYAILPLYKKETLTCSALEYAPIKGEWASVFDALLFIKKSQRCHIYKGNENYDVDKEEVPQSNTFTTSNDTQSKTSTYQSIRNSDIARTITGKIVNGNNGAAIPYVNIGLKNDPIGTISNNKGQFELNISNKNLKDTVCFSCIGYKIQYRSITSLLNDSETHIKMAAQNYNLNEVTISVERLTAKKILRKAIKAIDKNYCQHAYTQDVLFRKKDYYANSHSKYILEYVNRTYDGNGYKPRWLFMTSVKEDNQRLATRIANIDSLDKKRQNFKAFKHQFIPFSAYQDLINYRKNCFLNPMKWFRYDFQLSDTLEFNGQTVFRIDFKCKYPSHRSTLQLGVSKFYGYIFINMDDYAIVKIESTTINDKNKVLNAERYETYQTKKIWFERDVVFYRKQGNYYFMDYTYHHDNWSNISYCERFGFKANILGDKSFKFPRTSETISDDFWSPYMKHPRYKNKYQHQETEEFSKNKKKNLASLSTKRK